MELVVRGARGGGVVYWARGLLTQLGLGPAKTEAEDRDSPVVIAKTTSGEEHILQRTGTYRQAVRARDHFQAQLDGLGEAEFRRRYGLPEALK